MPDTFIPFNTGKVGWNIQPNGCHVWTGCKSKRGYGKAWDSNHGCVRHVHQIRYEREVGPVPDGLVLDHFACDNRLCCNPKHLRPVTHRENILRGNGASAWVAGRKHCPKGHELAGDNLLPGQLKRGGRSCRRCANDQWREGYRAGKWRGGANGFYRKSSE